jgi:hypothetical protein
MLALSVRQPFAELILRGIKTIEYRSRPTKILGERFHIYASGKKWSVAGTQWPVKAADNIVVPNEKLPEWMLELAAHIKLIPADLELPTGVIVGSAVISKCEALRHEGTKARSGDGSTRGIVNSLVLPDPSSRPTCLRASVPSCLYAWHLTDVQRARKLRKPAKHPQPAWFNPF